MCLRKRKSLEKGCLPILIPLRVMPRGLPMRKKYLDTIEQNLETLWKAFADSAEVTQLIAEIELIIIELRNAEPSEWFELLQELEAKIEQLRILLGDIASAAPALKALAEALNGLLSVSISGLRQAAGGLLQAY